jgi:tRNA(Ile)-lysidine synthase
MKAPDKSLTRVKRQRPIKSSRQKLSAFSHRLLAAWRALNLPSADVNIIVAVSGGADSVALLLAIDELIRMKQLQANIVVAHLDHGLRTESRADAKWVAELANQLGYEFLTSRLNIGKRAAATGDNLEQAARRGRYEFLAKTAKKKDANLLLTAHTMDDQAETVLLRLLRGSGAEGLVGIEPVRPFDSRSKFLLARPLLTWARRTDTQDFCRHRQVDFRSDPMNEDERFARVRVRKQLIPLMESFNGKIVEALARTAELLRDDLTVLNQQAELLLRAGSDGEAGNKAETKAPPLNVRVLANAPPSVRRRALRKWISDVRGDLRRLELAHIVGIESLLKGAHSGRTAELPGGGEVVRKQQWLRFVAKKG